MFAIDPKAFPHVILTRPRHGFHDTFNASLKFWYDATAVARVAKGARRPGSIPDYCFFSFFVAEAASFKLCFASLTAEPTYPSADDPSLPVSRLQDKHQTETMA